MKYSLNTHTLSQLKTDCLIIPVSRNNTLSEVGKQIDTQSHGLLSKAIKQGDISSKLGNTLLLTQTQLPHVKRILLIGIEGVTTLGHYQLLASKITLTIHLSCKDAVFATDNLASKEISIEKVIYFLVSAFNAVTYQFQDYKTNKKTIHSFDALSFYITKNEEKLLKPLLKNTIGLTQGINLTKDLANTPTNVCVPEYLAQQAQLLAKQEKKIRVKIHDHKAIKKMKMGALLGVGQGSKHPPYFIEFHYQGAKTSQAPIILVGKGITFDTGGISLKPSPSMEEMKYDMCGAATVFGVLKAIAQQQLPLNIIGLVPTAENMPDGHAYKPGDVLTSMSGQTIEINNTDAEGRLILCDALTYAKRFNPKLIIDMATLTGAMVVSLGHVYAGAFSRDEKLSQELAKAASDVGDKCWAMPLDDEYQKDMDSQIADMKNAGGRYAGAITAACFLARFVEKNQPWIHMDIAGVANVSNHSVGATGRPVSGVVNYLQTLL
jgi:leucyl aminopeptidase